MRAERILPIGIIFICALCLAMIWHSSDGFLSNPSLDNPDITMPDITTASTANHSFRFGCSYDWPGWWPWAIAQEKQLFEANSAHVELQWFDDYYEALDALAQGALDANCQVFNDTLVMVEQAVDGEVVVLVTDYSDGNDKIIVTDQITIPTHLAGHRFGVERGKLTEFLLTLALEKAGISHDDVDIRYANTNVGAIAFVAGAVDGSVAWQPDWLTALKRPGSHELLSSHDFPGAIPQVVVVTQKMISEQEDEVQALINTWFDTLEFIRLHPDESAKIMLRRSTLSDSNYQHFMQGVHLLSATENIAAFTPGETLEHLSFTAQKAADFLMDVEEISLSPDLTGLLEDEFVRRYE